MLKETKDSFFNIAKEISSNFGTLLGTRPYIAIVDGTGAIRFIETALEKFSEFITNFVRTNFSLLNKGDHSLPLGGVNLAFFKISEKAMIVIYTVKGRSGQLLAFKAKMDNWTKPIDDLIGDIELIAPPIQISDGTTIIESEPEVLKPKKPKISKPTGIRIIPVLKKDISGKKFPLEVANILQYCDGNHSIDEICKKTQYPRLKVDEVIRTYQKKKIIELKRIIS